MNILVFDIGGTYIKYALMNEEQTMLDRGRIGTPREGREQLIGALSDIYDRYEDVCGIAISMPGIIDSEKGYCRMGGALRCNDGFYLRRALEKRCPVPIFMENDAKCAAMAEAAAGSLADVSDGFVLIFGTMIGGGYVKDHRVVRGRHFSAGEISYITTSPGGGSFFGERCGVPGLCALYAERKGMDPGCVDGVEVFRAVAEGDVDALAALDEFAREIALQIFNLQTVLDPERFAIGGGISAQAAFTEAVCRNLEGIYAACPYPVPRAEVVTCRFRNDANLIGALSWFLAEGAEHGN